MATDKSEPRIGLIFLVAAVAVFLLVALRSGLVAYFDGITQTEQNRKIVEAKPEALLSLRSDEARRLDDGPLPIAQAMHELAVKGRLSASPDIVPEPSTNLGPLEGWTRMPAVVPAPMRAAAASADAGAAAEPSAERPAAARSRSAAPAKKSP